MRRAAEPTAHILTPPCLPREAAVCSGRRPGAPAGRFREARVASPPPGRRSGGGRGRVRGALEAVQVEAPRGPRRGGRLPAPRPCRPRQSRRRRRQWRWEWRQKRRARRTRTLLLAPFPARRSGWSSGTSTALRRARRRPGRPRRSGCALPRGRPRNPLPHPLWRRRPGRPGHGGRRRPGMHHTGRRHGRDATRFYC